MKNDSQTCKNRITECFKHVYNTFSEAGFFFWSTDSSNDKDGVCEVCSKLNRSQEFWGEKRFFFLSLLWTTLSIDVKKQLDLIY
jgi:hypothetical protein